MGRSVNYLTNASEVTFFNIADMGYDEEDNFDEDQARWGWEDFVANIKAIRFKYKSLNVCEEWDGNEVKIILQNQLVQMGVSEYGGCASVSLRVNPDTEYEGLAEKFISQNWNKMLDFFDNLGYSQLRKVGNFSNGEGVYELRNRN